MSNITEHPTEILPGRPPFIVFFLPQGWAVLLALVFEYFGLEQGLTSLLTPSQHQQHWYALLGLAGFALANVHSYLSGCVVCARTDYNVKLPNMYADSSDGQKSTTSKANAIQFNCIQRGHQNFVENLPQVVSVRNGIGTQPCFFSKHVSLFFHIPIIVIGQDHLDSHFGFTGTTQCGGSHGVDCRNRSNFLCTGLQEEC